MYLMLYAITHSPTDASSPPPVAATFFILSNMSFAVVRHYPKSNGCNTTSTCHSHVLQTKSSICLCPTGRGRMHCTRYRVCHSQPNRCIVAGTYCSCTHRLIKPYHSDETSAIYSIKDTWSGSSIDALSAAPITDSSADWVKYLMYKVRNKHTFILCIICIVGS